MNLKFQPYRKSVTLRITRCTECPHCKHARTPQSGYAIDYFCKLKPIDKPLSVDWRGKDYNPHGFVIISGYVEHSHEEPQIGHIPAWCPLAKKRKKT